MQATKIATLRILGMIFAMSLVAASGTVMAADAATKMRLKMGGSENLVP